jgi:hypothetical protein
MGRWLEKMHSHIQECPHAEPIKPQETPFIGFIGSQPVGIEKLKEAEEEFTSLDTAPPNVVLCVPDPDHPGYWLAYRRTNRTQQGRGDSQASAVLELE